jgi:PAS domain S-box-containing protein
MCILWGQDRVQIYNDAMVPMYGNRHPRALGQKLADTFPQFTAYNEEIYDAVERGESVFRKRQKFTDTRSGTPRDAWFDLSYSPLRDDAGNVAGVLHLAVETTAEVESYAAVEAERIAAEQLSVQLGAEGERLRTLFQQAPGFMCVLRGPTHIIEMANLAYERLIGYRPVIGRPVVEALPEVEAQGYIALLDGVYTTGKPYVGRSSPFNVQRKQGGASELCYVDFIYQPITNASGEVTGIFVEGSEVTDRVLAAERQALIARESLHRVKNTIAAIQAIMTSTARSSATIEEFTKAFESRVGALARTHSLLTEERWQAVPLADLVAGELSPYDHGTGQRIVIEGPPIDLPSDTALSLGMAIHELTTNAAKYGALSAHAGSVEVRWQVEGAGDDRSLQLTWRERGGPPVEKPTRQGFGTRLIERVLKAHAEVSVETNYAPDGLCVSIQFRPATRS